MFIKECCPLKRKPQFNPADARPLPKTIIKPQIFLTFLKPLKLINIIHQNIPNKKNALYIKFTLNSEKISPTGPTRNVSFFHFVSSKRRRTALGIILNNN